MPRSRPGGSAQHYASTDSQPPRNGKGEIAFRPLARALIGAGPGDSLDLCGKADAIEIMAAGEIPA